MKKHQYQSTILWTGNQGQGTKTYTTYERSYLIEAEGKSAIQGSSDPAFRGDKTKHNPEDLLVSAVASCHMLWYLHLCSENNVIVEEYSDTPQGIMIEEKSGKGYFEEITLNPIVVVSDKEMVEKAIDLHEQAHEFCFIANSVNFPIGLNPIIKTKK